MAAVCPLESYIPPPELYLASLTLDTIDAIDIISDNFAELTQTRGMIASPEYRNFTNAIELGSKCSSLQLIKNDASFDQGIVFASKTDALKVGIKPSDTKPNDLCDNVSNYLFALSSNAYYDKGIHLVESYFIGESVELHDLTFDFDEDYLLVPFSTQGGSRFSHSSEDENFSAKIKILANHLKALAISGSSNDQSIPNVIWVKQTENNKAQDVPRPLSILQEGLVDNSAALILNWDKEYLTTSLVTKETHHHKKTKFSKSWILNRVNGIVAGLKIQGAIATRAPKHLLSRGMEIQDDQPPNFVSINDIWIDLGAAFLPAPFSDNLKKLDHLYLIPDGALASLPYSALINPHTGNTWIEDFSLSILPDFVSLAEKRPHWSVSTSKQVVAIGNPTRNHNYKETYYFPNLPGAEDEAQIVSNIWASSALLKERATVNAFEEQAAKSSIVHIAAHGIADSSKPLRSSFLALSPGGPEGNLTGLRILNGNYDETELAIMSACQSGLGYQHEQGIIGLARAFYITGVPRVVMSLWNVDDDSTKYLMANFHQLLKTEAPGRALRLATLAAKEKYKTPDKWASFMLFGQPY